MYVNNVETVSNGVSNGFCPDSLLSLCEDARIPALLGYATLWFRILLTPTAVSVERSMYYTTEEDRHMQSVVQELILSEHHHICFHSG